MSCYIYIVTDFRTMLEEVEYRHWISESERGGRVYEIKTLRSNLAPEEGGRHLFEGGI